MSENTKGLSKTKTIVKDNRTFKERKSFSDRREEMARIHNKYPYKIPIIVERYKKEKNLPQLDKEKFLVLYTTKWFHLVSMLRYLLSLNQNQSFFVFVNNHTIPNMFMALEEIYKQARDEDGFLYVTYASQEMFG